MVKRIVLGVAALVVVGAGAFYGLTRPQPLVSRGVVALKGKSEPVEVFAAASDRALPTDVPHLGARTLD